MIPYVLGREAMNCISYDVEDKITCYDEELETKNSSSLLLLYLYSMSSIYIKLWHMNARNTRE